MTITKHVLIYLHCLDASQWYPVTTSEEHCNYFVEKEQFSWVTIELSQYESIYY